MITDSQLETLRRHLEAENAHHMDETLATLSPNCEFDDKTINRVFRGHAGAAEYYRLWWNAFGVTVHTDRRYQTDSGLLVVETNFVGAHVGDFLGLRPTGRDVSLPMAIFVTMEGDLLAGERFYWDAVTLLRQLGINSIPPEFGETAP